MTVQSNAVGVVPGSSGKSDPVGSTSVSGGPLGGKVLDANTSSSVSSETTSASSSSILQPSHHEQQLLLEDSSARQMRAYTVERLWSITEDLNVLYKENWTRLAEREVLDLQERMTQRSLDRARTGPAIYGTTAVQRASGPSGRRNHERRLAGEKRSLVKGHRRWTFASSFLYSLTLITTIGTLLVRHFSCISTTKMKCVFPTRAIFFYFLMVEGRFFWTGPFVFSHPDHFHSLIWTIIHVTIKAVHDERPASDHSISILRKLKIDPQPKRNFLTVVDRR